MERSKAAYAKQDWTISGRRGGWARGARQPPLRAPAPAPGGGAHGPAGAEGSAHAALRAGGRREPAHGHVLSPEIIVCFLF